MSAEFASWRSYWDFVQSVSFESRYVHGLDVHQFLDTVRATAGKRVLTLEKSSLVWRAQLGSTTRTFPHEDEDTGASIPEEVPFPPERMKPPEDRAPEGRVNPKGIPYLYLSSDRETAMAEVRPWIQARISVGECEILNDLKLVDCSASSSKHILYLGDQEPSQAEREIAVWGDIDRAFAQPVTATDDRAAYVPTQMLAEVFKQAAYDGLAYRSSCAPGKNYALFGPDAARLRSCHLFAAKSLKYSFAEVGNSYHVRNQRPD